MTSEPKTAGACNCGAVTFEISTALSDVYVCHCSICRRATGSSGIAVAIVKTEAFKWTKGEDSISYWAKPGHEWHTSFCQHCGSTLPGENDPTRLYVPVSLLTKGAESLKVAHHLWVESKASWEELGDTGVQHRRGFEE